MSDSKNPVEEPAVTKLKEAFGGDVPTFYSNGFAIGLTNADVAIIWSLTNRPIQVSHLSYTLAKTLHIKLGDVVKKFEEGVGQEMLTTDKVDNFLKEDAK